jgi:tellurite resistance protein TehA-like permease
MSKPEHPRDVFRHLGPNWYASVMGTGIVANAAILLPAHAAALRWFALGLWVLDAALLVALTPRDRRALACAPRDRPRASPRPARRHLPFSLTWWSFTFPVGTLVTATSELAVHTHAGFLTWTSVALYALLTGAWFTAATGTAHGALRGRIFCPPQAQGSVPPSPRRSEPSARAVAVALASTRARP